MTSRSGRLPATLQTQTLGSQSRIPRTIPVISPESFSTASMAGQMPSGNFSLTSSHSGSRRYNSSRPFAMSSGSYPDSDDYFLPTSSTMNYPSMSISDDSFVVPMMSSLSGFDVDFASEYLTDEAFSSDTSADLTFVSPQYPGHGDHQDHLNANYMPLVSSLYMPGPTPSFPAVNSSPLTPPPDEEYQQHCYVSGHMFQDQSYPMDKDFSGCESNTLYHISSDSLNPRIVRQPRPIRSASERDVAVIEYHASSTSPPEDRSPPKEDQPNREKARGHSWYNAKPDANGKFTCPMAKDGNCSHQPTTQRCVYNKHVDSHLRPYRCKFTDRVDCEELRFSSNACLLRHEREAHGEHTHGMNPYLCKFPDCDRAREGNGFPRRWNQRDHMKRVHQYEETDAPTKKSSSSQSQPKRRKASNTPASVPMRRSGSSTMSKAHAMVNASIPLPTYGPTSRTQYSAPSGYSMPAQGYNAMMTQPVSMSQVQFSQPVAISRISRVSPPYSGAY